MTFIALLVVGGLLIILGFFGLLYKLYFVDTTQAAFAETIPETSIFFGLLNWKRTKVPLSMMLCGIFMVGAVFIL